MPLTGHYKQILSSDFHYDGYQLATGSQDNSIRIWDLRKKSCIVNIPAHMKIVSDLHFEKVHSRFLYSCSYDGTVKVFSTKDWIPHYSLDCAGARLSSVSMTQDTKKIYATSMEKKFYVYEARPKIHENNKGEHMVNELSVGDDN